MDHFTHGRPRQRQQAVRGPRGGPAVGGASLLAGLSRNLEMLRQIKLDNRKLVQTLTMFGF
jgi:hypothetical protein